MFFLPSVLRRSRCFVKNIEPVELSDFLPGSFGYDMGLALSLVRVTESRRVILCDGLYFHLAVVRFVVLFGSVVCPYQYEVRPTHIAPSPPLRLTGDGGLEFGNGRCFRFFFLEKGLKAQSINQNNITQEVYV